MLALQIGQEHISMGQSLHLALNSVFGYIFWIFKYIFRYTNFNENVWGSCCT